MRMLEIKTTSGNSKILFGESIKELTSYCTPDVIITDENVRAFHGSSFPNAEIIQIGQGEKSKTLDTVNGIYDKFLELELDRSSFVVAIGGGIVCDVAGFAASTYLRGLHFGFVPTTLLAQVDASIGGKNGVNFKGYKNLIGTFNQPEFVLCDFEMLKTLPEDEVRNGMAEMVKHSVIGDNALFSYIEENHNAITSLHRTAIEKAVYDSVMVKARIVNADEREQGERRKLNFGHTLGHAIEKVANIPHGSAISIGMAAALNLSVAKGLLAKKDAEMVLGLLDRIGLPTKIGSDRNAILDAIRKDKKRANDQINFILLEAIGKARIVEVKISELEAVLNHEVIF